MQSDLLSDDLFAVPSLISPATLNYLAEGAFPRNFLASARKPALPAAAPRKSPSLKQSSTAMPKEHKEKSPNAFKTISEAAHALDVPQHVLRFWESRFTQIKPLKRSGGRRYYRPEDMAILSRIKQLLYKEGYTIDGAKKAFSQAVHTETALEPETVEAKKTGLTATQQRQLNELRAELVQMKSELAAYIF